MVGRGVEQRLERAGQRILDAVAGQEVAVDVERGLADRDGDDELEETPALGVEPALGSQLEQESVAQVGVDGPAGQPAQRLPTGFEVDGRPGAGQLSGQLVQAPLGRDPGQEVGDAGARGGGVTNQFAAHRRQRRPDSHLPGAHQRGEQKGRLDQSPAGHRGHYLAGPGSRDGRDREAPDSDDGAAARGQDGAGPGPARPREVEHLVVGRQPGQSAPEVGADPAQHRPDVESVEHVGGEPLHLGIWCKKNRRRPATRRGGRMRRERSGPRRT